MADKLTDDWPRHWTKQVNGMLGMVSIDGKPFRICGPNRVEAPALAQKAVIVTPTRSIYQFEGAGVRISLEFCSPLLPSDVELLVRPVTYLTLSAASTDGKSHAVKAYWDWTGEFAVHDPSQQVAAGRHRLGKLVALSLKSQDQPILKRVGDWTRIDWGGLYVASADASGSSIGGHERNRGAFIAGGTEPNTDELRFPRAASDDWPVLSLAWDFGSVGSSEVERTALVGYDEVQAIEYFRRPLDAGWRKFASDFSDVLVQAQAERKEVLEKCKKFDAELTARAEKLGGTAYAYIIALAHRQSIAANGTVFDIDGRLLMFPKENTSNGCIATVDVFFPSAPHYLDLNPDLMAAQLEPVFEYSRGARWKFPFAPHDLGTYPKANGQVYGGGERTEENQMPVEESANMILIAAALKQMGNKDYFKSDEPTLLKWAEYLLAKGFDPENQLCTDDFTGHLAHNANLSIKAILAIGAYGKATNSAKFSSAAKQFAADWLVAAKDEGHTRLAFDKPGTWSLKYNLVWDRILGLNLFPKSLIESELKWYESKMNAGGVPLDNRADFTKTDWVMWVAAMIDDKPRFTRWCESVIKMLNETKDRVPFTDWYETKTFATRGMFSRSVIGGVFMPLLVEKAK